MDLNTVRSAFDRYVNDTGREAIKTANASDNPDNLKAALFHAYCEGARETMRRLKKGAQIASAMQLERYFAEGE